MSTRGFNNFCFLVFAIAIISGIIELFDKVSLFFEENKTQILSWVALIVILIILIVRSIQKTKKENAEKVEKEIDRAVEVMSCKYGTPDRVIKAKDNTIGYIAFFSESGVMCINDVKILFSDIVSFKLIDNYQIERGSAYTTTRTRASNSRIISRSMEGFLWGGKKGAIIGGATTPKKTSVYTSYDNDKLVHDYVLLVNMKGFNTPGVEIAIGNDWRLAAELEHLFDQIIKENSPSMS